MSTIPSIAVLLSTYNGELYLGELLDSLLAQTYTNFMVYVRDDGSTDNTTDIIETYTALHPNKIIWIGKNTTNIGVRESFDQLLVTADCDYYAFCDQDDVWLPHKLDRLANEIKKMASTFTTETPIMVFSDMDITDGQLNIIQHTFYEKNPFFGQSKLDSGLFQGYISGCLMLFNKPAKALYLAQKRNVLHDYILLIVASWGKISFIKESLILHRIHGNNCMGISEKANLRHTFLDFMKYLFRNKSYRDLLLAGYYSFVTTFRTQENDSDCRRIEMLFANEIDSIGYFARKKWFLKHFLPFNGGWISGAVKVILF